MQEQKSKVVGVIKKIAYTIIGIVVFVILIGSIFGNNDKKQAQAPTEQNTAVAKEATNTDTGKPEISKEEAQKELTELMDLSKQANLVVSYEFSDTANVVYVTNLWYSLDVPFKKDFLAKVATLKETITGYHRFEVRNVKSNEKVAEVTAFSGSLEVYK